MANIANNNPPEAIHSGHSRHARPLSQCSSADVAGAASAQCARCWLGKACSSHGVAAADLDHPHVCSVQRHLTHGVVLYRTGDHFHSLFVVRSGALKSLAVSSSGEEKITAFHFPGEMLGLSGINEGRYAFDVIAMEDTELCVVPYAQLVEVTHRAPDTQRNLFTVLSCAIGRHQGLLELLEQMSAEQRVAASLLNVAARYEKAGYPPRRFPVAMTRIDLGSYLGLAHETVTRVLSHLHKAGHIQLEEKYVELKNVDALVQLVAPYQPVACECDFFGC